jgi:hypothetical protein
MHAGRANAPSPGAPATGRGTQPGVEPLRAALSHKGKGRQRRLALAP